MSYVFQGALYDRAEDQADAIAQAWLHAEGNNSVEFIASLDANDEADECIAAWSLGDIDAADLGDAMDAVIMAARREQEEADETARQRAIDDQVMEYPGFAREVWGGWVFCVINSQGNIVEQPWSRARTQTECHQKVYDAVDLYGLDGAFDYGNDGDV